MSKYSDPTLKYLFGTASQCAHPECSQPLIARERGKPTVLVQIAHIRSEKENGPRYDPNYPKSEINAFPNLLLLCPPHHKPVDDNESDYTVDELEQWKEAQIAQQGQTLSAPDVSEIAEQISESSIASVGAIGVTNLARAVRILIENARRTRELPRAAVRDWNSTYEDARSRHVIWDADGNRIYAEPSRRETLEHKARVVAALQEAVAALSPLADAVHGELQAISAVHPELDDWCTWVDNAARSLLNSASRWPDPRPFQDDEVWPGALALLERASNALTAKWRGEAAEEPPSPPPADEPPVEDPHIRRMAQHNDLLDSARPWARVDHRPFDREMYSQLLDAMQFAATLPPVMSNIASELNATAGLAAAVARNANDTEAQQLIEGASQIHPVASAVVLLERLARTYNKSSRADLESLTIETMRNTLESIDWTDPQVWTDNQYNVRQILSLLAAATSNDQVRDTIAAVLGENPDLLSTVIRACASWVEQVDIDEWSSMSIMRHYSDLPEWFPTAQVVRETNRQIPGATAADEFAAERLPEELDRLASQILYLELTTGGNRTDET